MSETSEARNVEVEVTLTDGLRYASVLPSTSPILRDLYVALGSKDTRNRSARRSWCNCRLMAVPPPARSCRVRWWRYKPGRRS